MLAVLAIFLDPRSSPPQFFACTVSGSLCVASLYFVFCANTPRLHASVTPSPSNMVFFGTHGGVARPAAYNERWRSITRRELLRDINEQFFANSTIASDKFRDIGRAYRALRWALPGVLAALIMHEMGW